jgi:cytochrome c oxidase subunit 1
MAKVGTIDTRQKHAPAPAPAPPREDYLNMGGGWKSWAATLDHKRIGVMYLFGILISFALAGTFALIMRTKLLTPGAVEWLSADGYNQAFTLHGVIMVFLVIIPGVPAALGNIVLPLLLGAKDVAFPRVNLLSFYMWVAGALMGIVVVCLPNRLDTGWTFYVPYSITTNGNVVLMTSAAFLLGFSSIFTGLNFITTIHKLRPPGMTWFRMPLFVWALYATAIMQVLATPVLGITLLLLIVERTMQVGIFNPALGGDPVLYQHFFWFYSHPAVYIMIVPAMGVISEIIPVFSRKHIFGYPFIAISSIAIALFGFIVWGHHMFVSGQSTLMDMIFSALTFSVSIPSAVKVFNWLLTMWRGSISMKTPMLYALAFIFLFTIGGLTGLPLATLSTDIHLTDTYFVIAHFHYVMMGSGLIAFFAGLFYWWPKFTGRMYHERTGQIGAILNFIGFNVTFFTQFMLGSQGMPRRYYQYVPEFQTYHIISTIGAYILLVGFLFAAYSLLSSLVAGRKAPANPWGGGTLEWTVPSPPPWYNFETTPVAADPYDMEHLVWDEKEGGYVPKPGWNPSTAPEHAHAH